MTDPTDRHGRPVRIASEPLNGSWYGVVWTPGTILKTTKITLTPTGALTLAERWRAAYLRTGSWNEATKEAGA